MPVFDVGDLRKQADDPRFIAAVDLVARNGARGLQIRYDEEQKPIVWVAVAEFSVVKGKISKRGKINAHQVGAGLDPLRAMFMLCHACLDRRGKCVHCNRNTMFDETFESQPLSKFYCWYQWDPELKTFRRGCEGD